MNRVKIIIIHSLSSWRHATSNDNFMFISSAFYTYFPCCKSIIIAESKHPCWLQVFVNWWVSESIATNVGIELHEEIFSKRSNHEQKIRNISIHHFAHLFEPLTRLPASNVEKSTWYGLELDGIGRPLVRLILIEDRFKRFMKAQSIITGAGYSYFFSTWCSKCRFFRCKQNQNVSDIYCTYV